LGKVAGVRIGGFNSTVESGSCTISDGCKWDFKKSRVEYDSSVAGARAAVVVEGAVTVDIVLYTANSRGDSGKYCLLTEGELDEFMYGPSVTLMW
jgi:hypothetical protein